MPPGTFSFSRPMITARPISDMSTKQGNIGVTSQDIFPIIKKFLYSDHDIFLRELVSNAVDATQKLKTLASVGEFKGELGDLNIHVSFDNDMIKVSDRGIGMTAEEIDKYINQIAFSGAEEFLEKYKNDAASIIGHFGLGFYSSFMLKFSFPNVSLLDFQKARELMNIGYKRTMQMMDSIKARIPRRVELSEINARRKAYRDSLPPLVFHNIYITGINEAQRKYIEAQLHRDENKDFTMEDFKRAYFKMLTYSKIKEILPHAVYNWKEKKFDLYLDVKMREEIKIGFGGNISSYQANQLFLGVGYQYLGYYAADVNTNFQVGNSFSGVLLNGRVYLLTGIPTYLNIQGAFSDRRFSESQSLFYEDVLPAFIRQKELYAKLKLGFPFLNRAKAEIGLAYGHLNDDYFQTSNMTFSNASSDRSWYNLFSGSLSIDQNSLNYILYPTSGQKHSLIAQYVKGNEYFAPSPTTYASSVKETHAHSWLQMKGEMQHYYNISSHLNLGLLGEVVISSKNLMSNYTSSVLQAPAFTPTIHSKIVFNEAFRANQYAAFGISPVIKLSKLLHFRVDMLFASL